jgi:hypothetical protein
MPEKKSWPYETPEELTAAGYEFVNAARCRGPNCGAMIEWWTTPNGKKMPLDPDTMGPHWATCPDQKHF